MQTVWAREFGSWNMREAEDDIFADCIFCVPLILVQLISKMVVTMHKITKKETAEYLEVAEITSGDA
jgi:hypothetical protein